MTQHSIQQAIRTQFDALSPELQRAARWVLRHGNAIALYSMRDSARAAGVTPATMTRLAQRLGFDGFESLRAPFRRQLAVVSSTDVDRVVVRGSGNNPGRGDVIGPLNRLQQANVASVTSLNNAGDVEAAAQTIVDAPQVYFLGMRVCHGVAFYMAYAYGLVRANGSLLTSNGGTLNDQVARIDGDSVLVAVSQSPYTRQTVEVVGLARGRGASVVALTDSPLSPLARGARHVLLYDTASNAYFHSTTGAHALAEALTATIARRAGEAGKKYLRRMQDHLRESKAYWERPDTKE